jgi:multiple antibiotic resistance protein
MLRMGEAICPRRKNRGRHLVEERLKQVVIRAVNQNNARRGALERFGGCQATKGRSACVGRANSCTLTIMDGALSDLVKNTLLVVGALFPIVNPVGNTPIFLSLTRGLSGRGRTALARTIALNGLALILTSIFIGTHILAFFGISLPVVQVGGGLIVISTGWALLRQSNDAGDEKGQRECNESDYTRQAFYPLTMPLTVGPGSISVAIAVGANRAEGSQWRWPLIAGMLIGSALISASIYLSYRFAERIGRTLGDSAMNVIIRLSSFILVCIGVQILWNGLSALLRTVIH